MHLVPQSKHPGEEKNGEDNIAGGQKGKAGDRPNGPGKFVNPLASGHDPPLAPIVCGNVKALGPVPCRWEIGLRGPSARLSNGDKKGKWPVAGQMSWMYGAVGVDAFISICIRHLNRDALHPHCPNRGGPTSTSGQYWSLHVRRHTRTSLCAVPRALGRRDPA
ncbi:hypothetical protein C8J56DRAFT_1082318 [Mycena floridula]|nr:hypothetical protein C8J56DRAFT_1082318 [Mycena floridula]